MSHVKGLLIYVLCIGTAPLATASDNLIAKPGESLQVTGPPLFGNNVTSRFSALSAEAKKSFLDFETVLPTGRLKKFFFYVRMATIKDKSPVNIRLQIWGPIGLDSLDTNQFRLVWQKIVTMELQTDTGILYTYTLPDEEDVAIAAGDRIGWTFEDDRGPISLQHTDQHRTYFRGVQNDVFPVVGQSYIFDSMHLPNTFSVAVEMTQALLVMPTPTTLTMTMSTSATVSTTTSPMINPSMTTSPMINPSITATMMTTPLMTASLKTTKLMMTSSMINPSITTSMINPSMTTSSINNPSMTTSPMINPSMTTSPMNAPTPNSKTETKTGGVNVGLHIVLPVLCVLVVVLIASVAGVGCVLHQKRKDKASHNK